MGSRSISRARFKRVVSAEATPAGSVSSGRLAKTTTSVQLALVRMDRDAGEVLAVAQSGVRTSRCSLASLLKLRLLPAAKVTIGSSITEEGSRKGVLAAAVPDQR